jgi:hypothetical protein
MEVSAHMASNFAFDFFLSSVFLSLGVRFLVGLVTLDGVVVDSVRFFLADLVFLLVDGSGSSSSVSMIGRDMRGVGLMSSSVSWS